MFLKLGIEGQGKTIAGGLKGGAHHAPFTVLQAMIH